MTIDTKNIIDLNLKKEEKVLNFSDFQKQNLKFDIVKLQEAYKQITQPTLLHAFSRHMLLVEYLL